MGFTTFSVKMFLVEPWNQNGESTEKKFLAYYLEVCHGFMTASEFSKAGEPSSQLSLKEIYF